MKKDVKLTDKQKLSKIKWCIKAKEKAEEKIKELEDNLNEAKFDKAQLAVKIREMLYS